MSLVSSKSESSPSLGGPPVVVLKALASQPGVSAAQKDAGSAARAGTVEKPEQSLGGGSPVVLKGSSAEAGRNLVLGVVAAIALIPIGGLAFWWAPQESFVAVATAVMVGLLLFLALQFRLLLQRNGVFLLLSGGLVLTLLVPLGVRLMETGSEWAQTLADFKRQQAIRGSAERNGVASTPAPQSGKNEVGAPLAKTDNNSSAKLASDGPLAPPASPDLKETPLNKASSEAVSSKEQFKEQFPEDPAARATRATQFAKDEAIRRYPELQIVGTRQHTAYLDAYNALVRSRKDEFFKDPQWPLKIAEILAASEGWVKFDERTSSLTPPAQKGVLPGSEINLNVAAVPSKQAEPPAGGNPVPVADSGEDADEKEAQKEVIRLYPAVGVNGTPQNKVYQACYEDLRVSNPDFFSKPDWPLRLVKLAAKQPDWKPSEGAAVAEKGSEVKTSGNKEVTSPQ